MFVLQTVKQIKQRITDWNMDFFIKETFYIINDLMYHILPFFVIYQNFYTITIWTVRPISNLLLPYYTSYLV